MGIKLFGGNSSSVFDSGKSVIISTPIKKSIQKGNPDPNNYKIIKSVQINDFLLLFVNYPDCTNYEGNKILLFKDTTLKRLKRQKTIDPHFSDNEKFISPIARFAPTVKGWFIAEACAHMLGDRSPNSLI